MPEFYDTHAHLDYPDFANDLPEVIERARTAGITRIICMGTDLESSRQAVQISERFPGVYAAVGWHPTHVTAAPRDVRPVLRELAGHRRVVAIGETGLDFYHLPSKNGGTAQEDELYLERQKHLFEQQLELAAELGLNCVIHQRDSLQALLEQIAPWSGKVRGVFHCFTNDTAALEKVLALGCMVSYTGIVTFKNAQTVRDSLAASPPGRFMLETDCPFLAPVPYRGKRCEPAHVRETAMAAAQATGWSLEDLSAHTCRAAHEFFPKLKQS